MKNSVFFLIILISGTVSFFSFCGISFAADSTAVSEINFEEDLGISSPLILPDSRFYFLKELQRVFSRFFAFDQINKAKLELKILNEKAVEMEFFSDDAEKLDSVFSGYQKTVQRLAKNMALVSDSASSSVKVDVLLDNLISALIIHQKFLDKIGLKYGSQDEPAFLADSRRDLNKILALIPSNLDMSERFRERLKNFLKIFPERIVLTKELRMAELIAGFEEGLSSLVKPEIQKFKEELLIKFQSRVRNKDLEFLKKRFISELPGDLDLRLKIFDELREKTSDIELKSRFNLIRQEILNVFDEKGISEEKARSAISLVEKVLFELEGKISSGEYLKSSSISEAMARAKFNLEQAKVFFESGNYGGTFGQASAALAASRSAMNKLRTSLEDFEEDFNKLRERFDEIAPKSKSKDKIKVLENLIISLSEMVKKKSGFDKINADFEKALKLLTELEESALEPETSKPVLKPREPVKETSAAPAPKQTIKNWTVEIKSGGEFAPAILNIKKGDSVTWKNLSANLSWPASAVHPDHNAYPTRGGCLGSSFDVCKGLKNGESFTFIFDYVGSWNYHDHLNAGKTGTIIVVD